MIHQSDNVLKMENNAVPAPSQHLQPHKRNFVQSPKWSSVPTQPHPRLHSSSGNEFLTVSEVHSSDYTEFAKEISKDPVLLNPVSELVLSLVTDACVNEPKTDWTNLLKKRIESNQMQFHTTKKNAVDER